MSCKKADDWRDSCFPEPASGWAVLTIYALFIQFMQRRMSPGFWLAQLHAAQQIP